MFAPNRLCPYWPAAPTERPHVIAPNGVAPILLLGNDGDLATPIEWAHSVQRQLPGSQLLLNHADAHGVLGKNDCATAVIDGYLLTGSLPEAAKTC